MSIQIESLQKSLQSSRLDGWLFYDFQGNNPLSRHLLGIGLDKHLTRRFFYWVPANGTPVKLVHAIELQVLDSLPGEKRSYLKWEELHAQLRQILKGNPVIAMEYSTSLPSISKVDAGTVELIRSFGAKVVSSASLLQPFTATWNAHKWQTHLAAAECVEKTLEEVWQQLREGKQLTEYSLQQLILQRFDEAGFCTNWEPICAVGPHSADPHFSPSKERSVPIRPGDFLLIDLGCKKKAEGAVYADFTRVACLAKKPLPRQAEIFAIVRRAQEAAIACVCEAFAKGQEVRGCDADRACRSVIEQAGYGAFFLHRTGHNIDEEVHGPGANLDSLETLDERPLLASTCFSVEPGIYLSGEFGVRLECDLYITPEGEVVVSGKLQDEILCLG